MRSKKPSGFTVQDLLDFIEQSGVSPDTPVVISAISQHDYEGDWRRGGEAVEVVNYDSFLSIRDACIICG